MLIKVNNEVNISSSCSNHFSLTYETVSEIIFSNNKLLALVVSRVLIKFSEHSYPTPLKLVI